MEGIREQLVTKERSPSDGIKKLLIIIAAFLLAVVIVTVCVFIINSWILMYVGIFGAIGVMWGGMVLSGNLNVEYEYAVVGTVISVDKIINKRSRKTLCEFDLRKAKAFYSGERESDCTEVYACGDSDKYSIEYEDEKYGRALLIFTPDEKTLEAVSKYLPRMS